jgi:uncharacterized protein (TIGR00106 family)
MGDWQGLLGIDWPEDACDRSGECCRGAAQVAPWANVLVRAARGDLTARAFISQFVPYTERAQAERKAPHGVAASLQVVRERGQNTDETIFYRCRFLKGTNECQVYEDRPALCRDFPDSPFGAVPACCGYAGVTRQCRDKMNGLRQQLADLKRLQSVLESETSFDTPRESSIRKGDFVMPHVMVDVTMVPVGTANTSISSYVAASAHLLKQFPDVRYKLNPMSTTLEGEWDRVMELIRRMHEAPFAQGAYRVSTTIRVDDRRDARNSMEGKIAAVQDKAGV